MATRFHRCLDIELPPGQSAFLWGARQTGKSTYLEERFPDSYRVDLLDTDTLVEMTKRPGLLHDRVMALPAAVRRRPVIVDEIQKVPALLDEVHRMIRASGISFVLCGSSARKLRRTGVNLLGGRAWSYEMFPLVSREVGDTDLLDVFNRGLVPSHFLSPDPRRSLKAYVNDYLKEEIRQEGLTRNLPAFGRFLDAAAFSNGELVNHANIARDVGVDAKTVREYFQILVDTRIGRVLEPHRASRGREIISAAPKFYLFDTGVASAISGTVLEEVKGRDAGHLFETFLLHEVMAYRSYSGLDFPVSFWRTKTGLEVDFVLGKGRLAVEAKMTRRLDRSEAEGLRAFAEECRAGRLVAVCLERERRVMERLAGRKPVEVIPWREFLADLWAGKMM